MSGNRGSVRGGRSKWRPRVTNLALLAISLFIGLLVAEFLVRQFLADQIVLFPRHHVAAKYGEFTLRRLRPNTTFWHESVDGRWKFETNSRGFRDTREFSYSKPDGVIRILSLGDSHTEGFEVRQDQTFSAVAERCLRARKINAEVINTGISGFSTAEELAFLEQEGQRYNPDFILLGFYANDFRDNVKAGLFALEDGKLVVRKKTHTPGLRVLAMHDDIALLRWLSENSYLYSLSLNTLWALAKKALLIRSVTEYAIQVDSVDKYQQELTMALLKRMHEYTRSRGIKLILLDIPRLPEDGHVVSSVPAELLGGFAASSDVMINSPELLRNTKDLSSLHVPHGHHHISEFTHRALGAEAAKRIADIVAPGPAPGVIRNALPAECRASAP